MSVHGLSNGGPLRLDLTLRWKWRHLEIGSYATLKMCYEANRVGLGLDGMALKRCLMSRMGWAMT